MQRVVPAIVLAAILALTGVVRAGEESHSPYNPLSMLAPEVLKKERIQRVTACFLDAKSDAAHVDPGGPRCPSAQCVAQTWEFDREGRVVSYDFHRVGSYSEYERDGDGEIVEAAWIDKMSGERTVTWARGKDPEVEPPRFRMGAARGAESETVRIADPCFSVDGVYKIVYETAGDLPTSGKATLERDLLLEDKGVMTPVTILVRYEYERFEEGTPPGPGTGGDSAD